MTEKEKIIVYLSREEISNKKIENILDVAQDFSFEELLKNGLLKNFLSADELQKIERNFDRLEFENSLKNIESAGIKILTIFSSQYPKRLIDLPDRPLVLYARGDLSLLDRLSVSIVGTRVPSNYGRIVTEKLAGALAEAGFVIISGLCYGVDEIAHKKTLEVGGKTIAVVGSGFNNIYPAKNTSLAKEIAEKGLLLSEYTPSFVPKRYTFPRRNRIVAGLCDGVLITEAGMKSGTVHTKEFALEYGKDVLAVPGSIYNSKSELPNHLIKTAQAECVLSGEDVLDFYGVKAKTSREKVVEVSFEEKTILDLLANGERDVDYLAEKSQIPVNILNSCLTTLEIRGLIKRLPAQTYAII